LSIDIRSDREIHNDPFGNLLTELSRRFSAFINKDQAEQVENPEDIYADAQDVESAIKWHNFTMSKSFPVSPTNVSYYSATEPDNDKVKLYLAGGGVWSNLGEEIPDRSGFGNNATINGDPVLVGDSFDMGIVDATNAVKSIPMLLNRPESEAENLESLVVLDNANLQITGLVTGISYFIRFKIFNLASQGGYFRTLYQKADDASRNNGIRISVTDTGRVLVIIKRANTEYRAQTATNTIAINTVYDLFVTYAVSGNVIHIYVNNSDKSLTDPGTNPLSPLTTDAQFMRFDTDGGYVYGDLYPIPTIWREKVVTPTEIGNHFVNKLTLASIPFGQVAVSNYSATTGVSLARVSLSRIYKWNVLPLVPMPSFTSASFSSSSFTT
jgi:hypothetical protein